MTALLRKIYWLYLLLQYLFVFLFFPFVKANSFLFIKFNLTMYVFEYRFPKLIFALCSEVQVFYVASFVVQLCCKTAKHTSVGSGKAL